MGKDNYSRFARLVDGVAKEPFRTRRKATDRHRAEMVGHA
jgi:hypothetical protein